MSEDQDLKAHIRAWNKAMKSFRRPICTIPMGLPSAGKSTWTAEQVDKDPDIATCSADYFFYDDHGNYNFDKNKLTDAHNQCRASFLAAMFEERDIIIDNTNIGLESLIYYFDCLKNTEYEVRFIHFNSPLENCMKRDKKNIPALTFERMQDNLKRFLFAAQEIVRIYKDFFIEDLASLVKLNPERYDELTTNEELYSKVWKEWLLLHAEDIGDAYLWKYTEPEGIEGPTVYVLNDLDTIMASNDIKKRKAFLNPVTQEIVPDGSFRQGMAIFGRRSDFASFYRLFSEFRFISAMVRMTTYNFEEKT
jgi:predicted kinase